MIPSPLPSDKQHFDTPSCLPCRHLWKPALLVVQARWIPLSPSPYVSSASASCLFFSAKSYVSATSFLFPQAAP